MNDGSQLSIYGGADWTTASDSTATEVRLHRVVARLQRRGTFADPLVVSNRSGEERHFGVGLSTGPLAASATIRGESEPLLQLFQALNGPEATVFICHASEDKPAVRLLAQYIRDQGPDVWFDEWEIRVGDSIVDKVSHGLESATHLIVVLSKHSANRP